MTSDAQFISAFQAQLWPSSRWAHRDHIKLAYLYLCEYGLEEGVERIRAGIQAHNEAHGIETTPTSGYHETMTSAWMNLVWCILQEYGPAEDADSFCDQHPELLEKKALRLFYSKDIFMSMEARQRFVEPDLAPLPRARATASQSQ